MSPPFRVSLLGSPYELQYAQALKFAPSATVYNGVIPDLERKYHIAVNHGIVNIDNYEEFIALRERAEELHEPIRLGLQVSLYVGNGMASQLLIDLLQKHGGYYADFGGCSALCLNLLQSSFPITLPHFSPMQK